MNYLFAAVLFGCGSSVVLLQSHGVRGLHLTVKRPSSELRTVDKVSNLAFSHQWRKVGINEFSKKWTVHELQTICCKGFFSTGSCYVSGDSLPLVPSPKKSWFWVKGQMEMKQNWLVNHLKKENGSMSKVRRELLSHYVETSLLW